MPGKGVRAPLRVVLDELSTSLELQPHRAVVAMVVVPPDRAEAFRTGLLARLERAGVGFGLVRWVRWGPGPEDEANVRELNRERDLWIPVLRLILVEVPDEAVHRAIQRLAPDLFSTTDLLLSVTADPVDGDWGALVRAVEAWNVSVAEAEPYIERGVLTTIERGVTLVVGEAGSGKTTLLRHLARHSPTGILPILVPLSAYAGGVAHRDFPEFLVEWVSAQTGVVAATVLLVHLGEVLLLLDGLDEVRSGMRGHMVSEVSRLVREGGGRAVITSRVAIEPHAVDHLVELRPLEPAEIEGYVRRALPGDRGERLAAVIEGDPDVRELARTPLLLKLLVDVWKATGRLPDRREELFAMAAAATVERSERTPAATVAADFDPTRPWFFVPFQPKGEGMVGREEALARLRTQLASGRPTSIGQTAAFTGIGGIGKTQLVVEYCWQARLEYPGGVYWFTADQDIDSQVLRLVEDARWVHPLTEPAVKLQIARHRLRTVTEALFVFDNVERRVELADLRPEPGRGCHVLLTSRVEQPEFARIDVDLLDDLQSAALLLREAGRTAAPGPAEERAVAKICEHLEGLPLALELAGAYLRRFRSRTFVEYAELLIRRGIGPTENAASGFERRSMTGHQSNLADALRVSDPLLHEHPGLDRALDVLAWSASASMGWPLLAHLVAPDDPDRLREGVEVAEALRVLTREKGATARFRMHRLVQEVRANEQPVGDAPELARVIIERLCAWFEARRADFGDLPAFESELEHLDAWIAVADALSLPDARARLRWLRAYPSWHRGDYHRSLREIDAALGIFQQAAAGDPVLGAHLWADRGVVLSGLGRYREALADEARALELRRAVLGERHPDTARSYDNVGVAYGTLGDYRKALELQTRALDIRRELLGERHPDTASSYSNVGGTQGALGDHHKALELETRALDIRRDVLGERHPDTATSYGNVGATHGDLGDHRKSLEFQTRALDIHREVLGERHPDTATSYSNVGATFGALGDHRKALELETRALDIRREVLGERHPDTAGSYNNVGATHGDLGDPRMALELQTRALNIRRDVLGERHPDTASSYNNVGFTLGVVGDHRKALELQTRALDIQREVLGERHPDTVAAAINVLITLHKLGRRADEFALARTLVTRLPPSTPRYRELLASYNRSRPAGFRGLGPEGPERQSGAGSKKKAR